MLAEVSSYCILTLLSAGGMLVALTFGGLELMDNNTAPLLNYCVISSSQLEASHPI